MKNTTTIIENSQTMMNSEQSKGGSCQIFAFSPVSAEPTICSVPPSGAVLAHRISFFEIIDNSCIKCRYFR